MGNVLFFNKKTHFLLIFRARTCVYQLFVVSLHAYFEIIRKTMHKTIRQILMISFCAMIFASCTTQKQMTYLADAQPENMSAINAGYTPQTELIIREGDAMSITVLALDQEAVAPYNLPAVVYTRPGDLTLSSTAALQYYVVDEAGDIDFPVLGKLHVAGLKRTEVQDLIKKQLEAQVLNPIVTVNMMNTKVSVMGEVMRPGQVLMTSGRMTILEALAAAGDLTPYGRRDNVLVTREKDGKLEIARLNLRSADIYTSPYYFMQQNDVIYVSPNKVRAVSSTNAGLWVSVAGTMASVAAVVVTVLKK